MTASLIVTGGNGFLGSAVRRAAAGDGFTTLLVSRRPVEGGVTVSEYTETPILADATLVHLAEARDPSTIDEGREREALRVLDALIASRPAFLIYASSAAVYEDDTDRLHSEDESVLARHPYAKLKLSCEAKVLAAGGAVVRLANLYGPGGMGSSTLLADIFRQLGSSEALQLRDPAARRDLLHVDDAARGIVALARQRAAGVFNLGTGSPMMAGELARLVLALAGEHGRDVIGTNLGSRPPSVLGLNCEKARRILNWSPAIPLQDGLTELLEKVA